MEALLFFYGELVLQLLIGSMVCFSVHWLTRSEGELLGFLHQYYEDDDGRVNLWAKPLFSCLACMGSVWGVLVYCFGVYFYGEIWGRFSLLNMLVYVLCLSAMNRVVSKLMDLLILLVENWDYELKEKLNIVKELEVMVDILEESVESKDKIISAMEDTITEMQGELDDMSKNSSRDCTTCSVRFDDNVLN